MRLRITLGPRALAGIRGVLNTFPMRPFSEDFRSSLCPHNGLMASKRELVDTQVNEKSTKQHTRFREMG